MDEILEINSPSTFVFRVSGDSMCEIGILDGDYVVVFFEFSEYGHGLTAAKEYDFVVLKVDKENKKVSAKAFKARNLNENQHCCSSKLCLYRNYTS